MDRPQGIIIFGANGSGKTTLGRELARILGFKHMDIEDYCFEESAIPYSKPRPREEYLELMRIDAERYRSFVISTVTGDLGEVISGYYRLAVYLSAPPELRMERVRRRSNELYGDRMLPGGDMYEREEEFFDFVENRPLSKIDRWAAGLSCPIIHADGGEDIRVNAAMIAARFRESEMLD